MHETAQEVLHDLGRAHGGVARVREGCGEVTQIGIVQRGGMGQGFVPLPALPCPFQLSDWVGGEQGNVENKDHMIQQ